MATPQHARVPVATPAIAVPGSLEDALDRAWLGTALASVSGGAAVASVEVTELIRTMASKVRIRVRFEGSDQAHAFCLKSFLDNAGAHGGSTDVMEADFYTHIAPRLTMRVPGVVAAIVDRETTRGLLVMDDMIEQGARFCSALEPLTPDQTALSLAQIARLHARSDLLDELPWVPYRAATFAGNFSEAKIRELLRDPRGEPLAPRTRDAAPLFRAMDALRDRNADRPRTMLHGDCHAGNLYWTDDGPGFTDWQMIQRGHWAQDVAYHIVATLPVEACVASERDLVKHYLDTLRTLGGTPPPFEQAWEDYRAAMVYGFFMWAITQKVERPIIHAFVERLGAAIERHDTYDLLGV